MATVTPWEVKGDIDYSKLIKQFGLSAMGKLPKVFQDNVLFRRGIVFAGYSFHPPTPGHRQRRNVKVAIKVKRKSSLAKGRIKNEAKWLKVLNKKGIGPQLLFAGKDYLVEEFVDGLRRIPTDGTVRRIPWIGLPAATSTSCAQSQRKPCG